MNQYFTLTVRKEFSNLSYVTKVEKKAVLQIIILICTSIESTLSSQAPMADLLALIKSDRVRIESSGGGGRWGTVRTRSSVLSPLSLS